MQHHARAARPTQGQITDKDARRVANAAVDAGWRWSMTGKNHGRLLSPDGETIIVVSGSASTQGAAGHLRRALRRAGLSV